MPKLKQNSDRQAKFKALVLNGMPAYSAGLEAGYSKKYCNSMQWV